MGKRSYGKNLNYNFKKQVEPEKRMGQGNFANMPTSCKYLEFDNTAGYRDGIPNSFTCNVADISGIYENERQP